MDTKRVLLEPAAIVRGLSLVAGALVATSISAQMLRYLAHYDKHVWLIRMIDLDKEHNIPSLFSALLLMSAALLIALIATIERQRQARDAATWMVLAVGFLLMAVDESISFHEGLIRPMRNLLGAGQMGIFYYAWVIPGIALVAALGVFFAPFLLRLPRNTAIAFFVSAAIYLGGALGVELVEGWYREGHGMTLTYQLMISLEEGMEMAGVITFIHALLDYIASHYGEVRFGFEGITATAVDPTEPTPEQAGQHALTG